MRVRRFIGDNVADTMGKVKRELGSEAVILQTREFREGGLLGLFGKMRVEISAAIEEKPMTTADKLPDSGYGYYADESLAAKEKPAPTPALNQDRYAGFNDHFLSGSRVTTSGALCGDGPEVSTVSVPTSASGSYLNDFNADLDLRTNGNSTFEGDYDVGGAPIPKLNFNANLNAYRSAAELGTNPRADTNSDADAEAKADAGQNMSRGADHNPVFQPELKEYKDADFYAKEQGKLLQEELMTMRRMLEKMNKQMEGFGEDKGGWPQPLQRWADFLEDRGINENIVNLLLRHVQQTLQPEEWKNDAQVFGRLEANVRQICGQIGLIQPGLDKPRVVALIGATGVGKTTTIGKLAAGFSIVDKRRVALITVDTYRVAAVEQLKTFGEIIGVPVKVVMNPVGLKEAVDSFADRELIFIDTAGRSPYHDLHMSELQAFLEQARPDFTMLVMSATTQYADQLKVYRRFEPLTTHLIFTKLDETGSAGSILNILGQTTLPTAYLSNGQNVPDDIEAATPNRIARYVLGADMPHV